MKLSVDFNQLARVGKVVALLGFLLPWVTVSCSGTELLTATGVQLMLGDPQPAGPLAGMAGSGQAGQEDAEPNPFAIAAFVAIALGLGLGLATRRRAAAAIMLAAAATGAALTYYTVHNMREEMRREMAEQQGSQTAPEPNPFFSVEDQQQMSQAMLASVRVKEEKGFQVTIAGTLLAAIFALLTLFWRTTETEATPAETPPA